MDTTTAEWWRDVEGSEEIVNFESLRRRGDCGQEQCRERRTNTGLADSSRPPRERK
jgi:hypothetical protein